jgi:tRNA(Ile)-lysidine synthase
VCREYDLLKLGREERSPTQAYSIPIALDGDTILPQAGIILHGRIEAAGKSPIPESLNEAAFDAAAITAVGFVARSFLAGDRIAPLGISGHRKVKEIFIDRKVPRERRAVWPIVTIGNEIAWLPGLVRSRAALISPSTETVLKIEARADADE